MIFCTLFNQLYLAQGIALYHSLEQTIAGEFLLYVLCMDELSAAALARLHFPYLRIVRLNEIEDDALKAAQANRSVGEFCWTCTTPLILYVQDRHPPGTAVAYVDADICFFSDPTDIFAELGDRSIFVHEHDFAPEHAHLRPAAGRFNVGVVAFRSDAEGRACLQDWKEQCLAECVMDPATGKCGDQHYLDTWPQRYSRLVISCNPGIGRGPWNIMKHCVRIEQGNVTIDGCPLVFYHYHSLRLFRPSGGFKTMMMAQGYFFDDTVVRAIYQPYARRVWRALAELDRLGFAVGKELAQPPAMDSKAAKAHLLLSLGGFFVPTGHNALAMSVLRSALGWA